MSVIKKEITVKVIIFPTKADIDKLGDYNESMNGSSFSSLEEFLLNEIVGGYSILYRDSVFARINPNIFVDVLTRVLTKTFLDSIINLSIDYRIVNLPNYDACNNIVEIHNLFTNINNRYINYTTSAFLQILFMNAQGTKNLSAQPGDMEYDDDDDDDDYYDDDDDDDDYYDDDDDDYYDDDDDFFEKHYGFDPQFNDQVDVNLGNQFGMRHHYDDTIKKPKKEKYKYKSDEYYGRSHALREASKAKKNIKRHGILISNDKRAIKKDRRIIKAFLEDFIPGDSNWINNYRDEVLKRWVDLYVMTKKEAKAMDKYHRAKSRKNTTIDRSDIQKFARNFLNTDNKFYDASR